MLRNGLSASPVLASRRPILEDGLYCMEQHRWHAAVSTLLPLIEGVVGDKTAVLENVRVPNRLHEYLDGETVDVVDPLGLVTIPTLAVLDSEVFARREFGAVEIDDEALNRHIVLHGRSAGFGTEVNAVRTLMVITALAELFDGPLAERVSVPDDFYVPDLLEEYGPLADLRAASRRRIELRDQPQPTLMPSVPGQKKPLGADQTQVLVAYCWCPVQVHIAFGFGQQRVKSAFTKLLELPHQAIDTLRHVRRCARGRLPGRHVDLAVDLDEHGSPDFIIFHRSSSVGSGDSRLIPLIHSKDPPSASCGRCVRTLPTPPSAVGIDANDKLHRR